jgi:putrescine transport system permease protein
MNATWLRGRWLIILSPLIFLLIFFLIPFAFAFKISFAEAVPHVPPFTDVITFTPEHHLQLAIHLGNYRYLLTDEVYGVAYLYSLRTAFFSTLICLLIGYPMAYAIARSPKSTQNLLLLVIILPFWTSFLLRVYALEGIIRDNGFLNTLLLHLGLISQPLHIMRTGVAVYIGIVYSYLPFMVLPLFATLEKLDTTLLEAAGDLGSTPRRVSSISPCPCPFRGDRRLNVGVHPAVVSSSFVAAWRPEQSDDRSGTVG